MKTPRNPARLIAELRKVIGKSQSQFAAMIGVSKHTIISVENRRNALSKTLAKRIQMATGTNLLDDQLQSPYRTSPYTREDFDHYREAHASNDPAVALEQFSVMQIWLKVLLLAATKPGFAGNRDRLPALLVSLTEWLEAARKKFKLENEIEAVLEDETRGIDRMAFPLAMLFQKSLKYERDWQGIDLLKLKRRLKNPEGGDWLIIEDEFRLVWRPVLGPDKQACKTRKNIPRRKFGLVTFTARVPTARFVQFIHQAKLQDSLEAALQNKQICPEL